LGYTPDQTEKKVGKFGNWGRGCLLSIIFLLNISFSFVSSVLTFVLSCGIGGGVWVGESRAGIAFVGKRLDARTGSCDDKPLKHWQACSCLKKHLDELNQNICCSSISNRNCTCLPTVDKDKYRSKPSCLRSNKTGLQLFMTNSKFTQQKGVPQLSI
jgi:hypothetical protein